MSVSVASSGPVWCPHPRSPWPGRPAAGASAARWRQGSSPWVHPGIALPRWGSSSSPDPTLGPRFLISRMGTVANAPAGFLGVGASQGPIRSTAPGACSPRPAFQAGDRVRPVEPGSRSRVTLWTTHASRDAGGDGTPAADGRCPWASSGGGEGGPPPGKGLQSLRDTPGPGVCALGQAAGKARGAGVVARTGPSTVHLCDPAQPPYQAGTQAWRRARVRRGDPAGLWVLNGWSLL